MASIASQFAVIDPEKEDSDYVQLFKSEQRRYRYNSNGFIVSSYIGGPEILEALHDTRLFPIRDSDVFISSYPKTGSTWLQEIAYLILNDFDYEAAKTIQTERVKFIEICGGNYGCFRDRVQDYANLKSPRLFKTHLPYSLLPPEAIQKKCKLLYVFRNPKDTAVSHWHFSQINQRIQYEGDFDTFLKYFLDDRLTYSPYWLHVKEFWDLKERENVLILTYEDLKRDLEKEIRRVAEFLGVEVSDEQIKTLAVHCDFDRMKDNPATNFQSAIDSGYFKGKFMRKGQVGDWKNYFTEEQNRKMSDYVNRHFGSSDIPFVYEL